LGIFRVRFAYFAESPRVAEMWERATHVRSLG